MSILDFKSLSVDQIVDRFEQTYKTAFEYDDKKSDFYCGVTSRDNIDDTAVRHNISTEEYLCIADTGSQERAAKVEGKLAKKRFDIGNPNNREGNGGNENSILVYMFKKTKTTTPGI